MVAMFNQNNNEISKELLVNKFNILDDRGRLVLNDQSITLPHNEPQRSPEFVQEQPPKVSTKGSL